MKHSLNDFSEREKRAAHAAIASGITAIRRGSREVNPEYNEALRERMEGHRIGVRQTGIDVAGAVLDALFGGYGYQIRNALEAVAANEKIQTCYDNNLMAFIDELNRIRE